MADKEVGAGTKEIARRELPPCHLGGERHWRWPGFMPPWDLCCPQEKVTGGTGKSKGEEWADV